VKEKAKGRKKSLFTHSGGENDPEVAKLMREMLSPGQTDQMFRQAIQV